MTYRGVVSNGVVVIEGEKPADGTRVDVTPVDTIAPATDPSTHPAIGVWKDRQDLPSDAVDASHELRRRLMQRGDE